MHSSSDSFTIVYIHLHSSTFVYTPLVTCLHSSTFVYTRLVTPLHSSDLSTLVYIRLHSSSDSSTLVYIHLHSSTFVYTRLVTRLCFQNRSFMSYPCDLFFITFIFIMINRITSYTDTLVLQLVFENMSYYFQMITWTTNENNFQIAKVQRHGVAQRSLDLQPILTKHCIQKCCS